MKYVKVLNYKKPRQQHIIHIQKKAREVLIQDINKLYTLPSKLPMIVKPKLYIDRGGNLVSGGYLNNEITYVEDVFIDKPLYERPTKLTQPNLITRLVNGLSQVPYKINSDVLDYIRKYSSKHSLIIDPNREELADYMNDPYKRRSSRLKKELSSEVSKVYMQRNILNIAEAYEGAAALYFPLRLDGRTRLYSSPHYLNYQSTDLAKGLISFADGEPILKHDGEAIRYLKSYGAITFDDKLSKKSLNTRVK